MAPPDHLLSFILHAVSEVSKEMLLYRGAFFQTVKERRDHRPVAFW